MNAMNIQKANFIAENENANIVFMFSSHFGRIFDIIITIFFIQNVHVPEKRIEYTASAGLLSDSDQSPSSD